MKIDPESGFKIDDAYAAQAAGPKAPSDITPTRVGMTISKALAGELSRDREPHYWEPDKLSPRHIGMILDRAQGMTVKDIAAQYDIDAARVSVILGHPDARTVMNAVMSQTADNVSDPLVRIQRYASEMLDIKVEIARDEKTPKMLRDKIATDLLDRAGFGARRQIDATVSHTMKIPERMADALLTALNESNRIADVPYEQYVIEPSRPESDEPARVRPPQAHLPVPASAPSHSLVVHSPLPEGKSHKHDESYNRGDDAPDQQNDEEAAA